MSTQHLNSSPPNHSHLSAATMLIKNTNNCQLMEMFGKSSRQEVLIQQHKIKGKLHRNLARVRVGYVRVRLGVRRKVCLK